VEAGGKKKGRAKKTAVKVETLPSAQGIRIEPIIADELKTKYAKAAAAKERKALKEEKVKKEKNVKEEKDEFDEMADAKPTLSDSGKKLKQAKLNFKPKKEKPARNPWSDEDDEDIEDGGSDQEEEIAPREKASSRAVTKKPAKYQLDESSDSDFLDAKPVKKGKERVLDSSRSDADEPEIQEVSSGDKDEFDISSGDEGLAKKIASKEKPKKAPPKKLTKTSDLMMGGSGAAKAPPGPKGPARKLPVPKKPAVKHKKSESENDKPARKKTKKKIVSDSEEDIYEDAEPVAPRTKPGGRSKAPVTYGAFEDSDSSDF